MLQAMRCENFLDHVSDMVRSRKYLLDVVVSETKGKKEFSVDEMVCARNLYDTWSRA